MARKNTFVPSYTGYRSVMNSHNEVMTACEVKGGAIAASASRQSGIDYRVDSVIGLNRVHTRVSTVTSADYFRERHYHALSIATSSMGGQASGARGYGSLMGRVAKADRKASGHIGKNDGRQTGWRAPGWYRKKR